MWRSWAIEKKNRASLSKSLERLVQLRQMIESSPSFHLFRDLEWFQNSRFTCSGFSGVFLIQDKKFTNFERLPQPGNQGESIAQSHLPLLLTSSDFQPSSSTSPQTIIWSSKPSKLVSLTSWIARMESAIALQNVEPPTRVPLLEKPNSPPPNPVRQVRINFQCARFSEWLRIFLSAACS